MVDGAEVVFHLGPSREHALTHGTGGAAQVYGPMFAHPTGGFEARAAQLAPVGTTACRHRAGLSTRDSGGCSSRTRQLLRLYVPTVIG